jgi:hypothetical protein
MGARISGVGLSSGNIGSSPFPDGEPSVIVGESPTCLVPFSDLVGGIIHHFDRNVKAFPEISFYIFSTVFSVPKMGLFFRKTQDFCRKTQDFFRERA